jgi:rhodanese-related sulfurtransferase
MIPTITAREAIELSNMPGTLLLDVRSEAEIKASGTALNALCIPAAQVWRAAQSGTPNSSPDIARATRIIIFCAVGARAQAVAEQLATLPRLDVRVFKSFSDWVEAGGRIRAA